MLCKKALQLRLAKRTLGRVKLRRGANARSLIKARHETCINEDTAGSAMCALLRATAAPCRFYYLLHSTAAVVHAEDPSARLPRPSGVARRLFRRVWMSAVGHENVPRPSPRRLPSAYARALDSRFGVYVGSEDLESESQVRRILLRKGDIQKAALGMPTVSDTAGTAGCPFDPRLDPLRLTGRVFSYASGAWICYFLELLSFVVYRLSLVRCLSPGIAVAPPGPALVLCLAGAPMSDLAQPTPLACTLTNIIRLPTITADLAGRAGRPLFCWTCMDGL